MSVENTPTIREVCMYNTDFVELKFCIFSNTGFLNSKEVYWYFKILTILLNMDKKCGLKAKI